MDYKMVSGQKISTHFQNWIHHKIKKSTLGHFKCMKYRLKQWPEFVIFNMNVKLFKTKLMNVLKGLRHFEPVCPKILNVEFEKAVMATLSKWIPDSEIHLYLKYRIYT